MAGGCSGAAKVRGALPLHTAADLALPGSAHRFDYEAIDAARHRLFVAHMADDAVAVVDLAGPTVVGTVANVPGATGLVVAPDLGRVFASAGDANQVVVIDETTLAVLARTPTGGFPDGLSYDPQAERVYVSDENGGDLTVIEARTGAAVGRIKLGGEAGNNAYDPTADRILVDEQSHNRVLTIDPHTDEITASAPLPGCDHSHGLHLDAAARLAFVACDHNHRLLVVDLTTMAVTARFALGAGPDVLDLDPGLHRLYVAADSGNVAVFDESGPRLRPLGLAFLADNAHSVAVDPTTHRVYFALPDVRGHPTLRVMEPA
jgi:DNA-binding beta-propeller fold protein YncE